MPMRGCYGGGKSGKTSRLQSLCARELAKPQSWRFLVLDANNEWAPPVATVARPAGPALPLRSIPVAIYRQQTVEGCVNALDVGARLVLLVPPMRGADLPALADQLAGVALDRPGVILVLPEAHLSCPEKGNYLPQNMVDVIQRAQHFGGGLWVDTQHMARLSKRVEDELRWMYFHGTASERDLDRARSIGGDALVRLIGEANVKRTQGERGWHVVVDAWNPDPSTFRLTR